MDTKCLMDDKESFYVGQKCKCSSLEFSMKGEVLHSSLTSNKLFFKETDSYGTLVRGWFLHLSRIKLLTLKHCWGRKTSPKVVRWKKHSSIQFIFLKLLEYIFREKYCKFPLYGIIDLSIEEDHKSTNHLCL